LGDPLPVASHLEDTLGAWSVSAAREAAWQNAGILEHLGNCPPLAENAEFVSQPPQRLGGPSAARVAQVPQKPH
jgi:hypothetical protein